MNTNTNKTTIYICGHHELVAPHKPLGRRRLEAVRAGASAAKALLEARGFCAEVSESYRDWDSGRFAGRFALPHNYFALPHSALSDDVIEAIREAANVYFDTLEKYEHEQ